MKKSGAKDRKKPADQRFLTGKLLIAMPNMRDPRFERSVILMCAHDEDHAMGVIVNKPLDNVNLSELLEQLSIDQRDGFADGPVYFGGPVQTDRGLVLHSLDYERDATLKITGEVGLTASREILTEIAGRRETSGPPAQFFLAIGHAGWGPGQLEQEIAMNAWAHCDPDDAIVFARNTDESWKKALQALGVTGAMLSPAWSAPRPDDAPLN